MRTAAITPWTIRSQLGSPARTRTVARVVVSHARVDRACAGQLHERLVAVGHEVFLDQDPPQWHRGGRAVGHPAAEAAALS
ncbi:MAG: hypothetical protein ACRDRE_21295 [Pseudonocardiaceae bacterium]